MWQTIELTGFWQIANIIGLMKIDYIPMRRQIEVRVYGDVRKFRPARSRWAANKWVSFWNNWCPSHIIETIYRSYAPFISSHWG